MGSLFKLGRKKLLAQVRVTPGVRSLVLALPHGRTADGELGATALAGAMRPELGARLVVAFDLDAHADVSQNPLAQPAAVRYLCLHYQNQVFADDPTLVVEWQARATAARGQSGAYDIEITPGFDLTPTIRADARFLERLSHLREALVHEYAAHLPVQPSIGVRGIDPEVELGQDSYALFKLRRQRVVMGIEHFGLRVTISLGPALLGEGRAGGLEPVAFRAQFALATARALVSAFAADLGLQPADDVSTLRKVRNLTPLAVGYTLVVAAPHGGMPPNAVALNAADLARLGVSEGGEVIVQHEGREYYLATSAGSLTETGEVGLHSTLRQEMHLAPGAPVTVGRPHIVGDTARLSGRQQMVVLQVAPDERKARMALSEVGLERLGLHPGQKVRVTGQAEVSAAEVEVAPLLDPRFSAFGAQIGPALAEKMLLSSGEVAQLVTTT